jgi:phosphoglycolate phosphatase
MGSAATLPLGNGPQLPAAMRGSRPRALILDFDGVIVDSVALKANAYVAIYAGESPDKLRAVLDHQRRHAGETRRVKFRHFESVLFGRAPTDETIEALATKYAALVHEAVVACPLIAGAADFLERAQPHAALHVVSGTPQEELEDVVRRRGFARWFASLRGAPTTKPEAFRAILAECGLHPGDVLAIGDGATECETASALGIPFLGVAPVQDASPFPPGVPVVASLEALGPALGFP